ncbi:plasmid maintenance system antidote protein VapI [Pedobacter africanus]|uniref:Plasmid maintenance system antidote protein VapI n=1 Tax=Pedobacter africanus TaxID=151894 RepID=A0ACC6KQZ2_9SPHI|nr:plasmid maintenance system antidote protein [Pedobacter africanus]MDR6781607.1 plasmid maintenance system antidote protein VapI [Pedobacter africanus]
MEMTLEKYKGIHPGLILERELKKRKLKKRPFALSLPEYPQIINDITKGKRNLTPEVSLKIDRALGLEEGTMYLLQAYYTIKAEQLKERIKQRPDLSLFRKALFWDTDPNKLDWARQYKSIIRRIFERGDSREKQAVLDFYGKERIKQVIGTTSVSGNLAIFDQNK